ncbi:mitochondrial glyco protein [Cylindrobasidium torrendii FP15055 ss-10]|uniref:Mitochondrial glyco protein n=1 Tax=Cylindrobasidium torrendii FP15055 ss-10 TaxID=1314674 RepID=A0A0D7B0V8_9AGAR|nr:mitochondrial glyco protein [Cylindrobasidium torrendii FP15055 ss-10]
MSAIRALRQASTLSARAMSARAVPQVAKHAVRAFSVTARAFGQGTTDVALATKLQEELSYEIEGVTPKETPEFIKEFQSHGVWTIEDPKFSDEVVFSRQFGNETIRLTFSVLSLRNEPEPEYDEEGNPVQEDGETETMVSVPIRISMNMTKGAGTGALSIDLVCQEGSFVVENVAYYTDAKVGTELSAEANFKRSGIYLGPQFDALDIGLQEEFERWLQERGVNETLAAFIPDYAEYKEQEEYTRWLRGVKSFVEA